MNPTVGTSVAALARVESAVRGIAAARSRPSGRLSVIATPSCDVFVDGVARGTTPVDVRVDPGSHTVTCVNAALAVGRAETFHVAAGEIVRKRLTMKR